MDPTYPLVPTVNFLSCVLVCIPLFSTSILAGSWNISITAFIAIAAAECCISGVNAILWSNNVNNIAPAWCDITTRIDFVSAIITRACTFRMTRSLYIITTCRQIQDGESKRKQLAFDLGWILGLPVLTVLLYYVVQESRFQIFEEEGCVNALSSSGLAILLFELPKVVLPMISGFYYCPRIFWLLYKRRKDASGILTNRSRDVHGVYLRMMILGCSEAVVTLPLAAFTFFSENTPFPTSFYQGWGVIHANFSEVPVVPSSEWKTDLWDILGVEWDLWINPFIACFVFAVFGLTKEARSTYRNVFWSSLNRLGLAPTQRATSRDNMQSTMRFETVGLSDNCTTRTRPPISVVLDRESEGSKVFDFGPIMEDSTRSFNGTAGDAEAERQKSCHDIYS